MDYENLIAIDIHTHAEVSCWNPFDNYGEEYDRAADKYFKNSRRPTIEDPTPYRVKWDQDVSERIKAICKYPYKSVT